MALRPWYSILNFDLAPKFHFVLKDYYVDLQQFPPQRNQTNMIKVCHIAAFHTTKKSRWSNSLLLYIPNSPRSLTLTSSPSQRSALSLVNTFHPRERALPWDI